MRDPFDDLRGLEGTSRPPLPPSEVRRRGDRLRRRRTALQVVVAAAAVAVIASGGVLVTGDRTGTGPPPPPATQLPQPRPTWVTEIPSRLEAALRTSLPGGPLRDDSLDARWVGLPCSNEKEADLEAARNGRTKPWESLGSTWLAGPDDRRTDADLRMLFQLGEVHSAQLVLYPDADTATEAMAAIREQGETCGSTSPSPATELRWSVRPLFLGDDGVLLSGGDFATGTDERVPGRMLVAVVRRGNAVLAAARSDESPAELDDRGADGARDLVDRTRRLAEQMCVFSPGGCADVSAPADPNGPLEPEALPYAISPEDLERHTGESGWTSTQGILEQPMVCAEESTEALAGDRTDTRMYARFDDDGATVGMATTTVLDFEPSTWAADGFERAAGWLHTCDQPLDRDHPVVDGGLGAVHSGSWSTGRYVWRTVTTPAPEVCDDCGLVWHHHQGVALGGDRLVILQVSTPGVAEQSGRVTAGPLPDMLRAAAALAAGATDAPGSTATGPATETFGPDGVRGLDLGADVTGGRGSALVDVVGGSRCQAFRLRGPGRPANNVDGFAERRRGVVVLLAREGMTTPQGVGLGSSRQAVLDAHPGGEDLVPGYRVAVPGRPGSSYRFGFDGDRVVSLMLARDGQRCIG